MKKFTLLFGLLIAASVAFSQALPFKYQAVIRDSDGTILTNKNVGLRVSIVQDTNSVVAYTEEFNQSSDEFGIIELEVGTGSVLSGNYLTIDWSKPANQLKIENRHDRWNNLHAAGHHAHTFGTGGQLCPPCRQFHFPCRDDYALCR